LNIINNFVQLRELISFGMINRKFDLDNIKGSKFDKNYMLKMKNDTDFLNNSSLSKFFNFSSDSDPFLVALSESISNEKLSIPINEELLSSIRNCQFILLQELINVEVSRFHKNEIPRLSSASRNLKKDLKPLQPSKSPDIKSYNKSKYLLHLPKSNIVKENKIKDLDYNNLSIEKSKYDSNKTKKELLKNIKNTPSKIHDLSLVSYNNVKREKLVIDDSKITKSVNRIKASDEIIPSELSSKYDSITPSKNETTVKELDTLEIFRNNTTDTRIEEIKNEEILNINTDYSSSDIKFRFYTDKINKFVDKYKQYYKSLNEEQINLFKINENLIECIKGISSRILIIEYNSKMVGMCIIGYDALTLSCIRLILSHFSTILFKFYQNILVDLIDFLKRTFIFQELFVELYYTYKVNFIQVE
jgi:hypothetical protein